MGYAELSGSINILKSLIGLGILTLPYATKQIGWIPSLIGMALIAYMTVMGILFAVAAKRCVQASESMAIMESPNEPEDTGLGSFDRTVWRAFGEPGRILCAVCIAVTQVVTGIAYVAIIAETLQPNKNDYRYVGALIQIGAVLIGLSLVRTLQGVSVLSSLGLLVYLFIFGALAAQVRHADPSSVHAIVWTKPGYGEFFGLTAFAFGAFVIPILVADELGDEKRFICVCSGSFIACWAFYSTFAMLGYFGYGSRTNDMIYKNFPMNSVQYSGSTISLCIILALTFVLQLLPVYNWAEKVLAPWKIHYSIARICVIFVILLFVYLLPSATFVISYVGGVAAVLTSFILPPLVYLRVGTDIKMSEIAQAWAVVIFGLVGGVFIFWIP